MERLLNKGADPNARDNEYGATALMWVSIRTFSDQFVGPFLGKGANINASDDDGFTGSSLFCMGKSSRAPSSPSSVACAESESRTRPSVASHP
jgi:hypothetical protein